MVLSIQKSQNNCSTHRRGQNKIHYNRDSKTLQLLPLLQSSNADSTGIKQIHKNCNGQWHCVRGVLCVYEFEVVRHLRVDPPCHFDSNLQLTHPAKKLCEVKKMDSYIPACWAFTTCVSACTGLKASSSPHNIIWNMFRVRCLKQN